MPQVEQVDWSKLQPKQIIKEKRIDTKHKPVSLYKYNHSNKKKKPSKIKDRHLIETVVDMDLHIRSIRNESY